MKGDHHVFVVAAMKRSIANTIRMCLSTEGEQPRCPRVSRWDSKEMRIVVCVCQLRQSHEHIAGEVPHLLSSRAVAFRH